MELQHDLIITEALKRGYFVKDISDVMGTIACIIEQYNKSELFVEGTPLSLINLRALKYFDNKQLTKIAFSKLNIPFPKSILFKHPDDKFVKEFFKKGKTYVCKPPNMTEGIGVEMNLKSFPEIEDYWKRNQHLGNIFMLEEQIKGDDLRIQVIGGKIVAACTREPAFVVGDGKSNLNQLIENRRKMVKKQNPSNDLVIDASSVKMLESQQISFSDVPGNGQKIKLNELANMSQGAVAIDVTDGLHFLYQEWINRISAHLDASYFAIDIITENFHENPLKKAKVLEINAKPEWLHHTFSEVKQHDIAAILLDHIFAKTI